MIGDLLLALGVEFYVYVNLSQRATSVAATWRTSYSSGTTLCSQLYPESFPPLEVTQSTDTAHGGWRWDASLKHGGKEFKFNVNHTANLSLGANSPTRFYAGKLENIEDLLNLDIAKDMDIAAMYQPLTLAFCVEARRGKYQIGAGDPASYQNGGAQRFSGFQPTKCRQQ